MKSSFSTPNENKFFSALSTLKVVFNNPDKHRIGQ